MMNTQPGHMRPLADTQMTQGGVSRAVVSVASYFRRHLWVWPLILAVVLGGIAFWVQKSLERTVKKQLADDLQNILKADVDALQLWLKARVGEASALALDPAILKLTENLFAKTDAMDKFTSKEIETELKAFREYLKPRIDALAYPDFFVIDSKLRVVASMSDAAVGRNLSEYRRAFFEEILKGEAKTSVPFQAVLQLRDEAGNLRAGVPTMLSAAPLRHEKSKQIFAALAFRIRPEEELFKILSLARFGQTGETYAFGRDGTMFSESRFDDDLKRVGLLPDGPDFRSTLAVKLRDPGVNLLEGHTPKTPVEEQPLTHMAQQCLAKMDQEGRWTAYNVDGYRDYRGVPVIGAWTWLKEFDFGVATESEKSEAFRSLRTLEVIFWILFGLLLLGGLVMLVLMLVLDRRQAALRKAVMEMKRLGQYQLDDKLGQGGMGSVYRAHHDLMRRPTAVKLLDADKISDLAIARFEREVQHTSRLTHPNTIAIYDFGRTPEGIFYYAMEYLDGLDLDGVVEKYGPQSEGRVIFILLQICGSLSEAHRENLIHRDIKPANVMLTDRGGCADFVKVLDFGLVKTAGEEEKLEKQIKATAMRGFTGTPMYLAPEGIESSIKVDHRTDLYAVGAVGYFLLTGTPPFSGKSVVEICMSATKDPIVSPSSRLGKPVSPDIEAVLMKCLQKNPNDRFQSIDEFAAALARCQANGSWTAQMAKEWWEAWKSLRNLKQTSKKATEAMTVPTPIPAAAVTNWS